jgi:hypothetical protein
MTKCSLAFMLATTLAESRQLGIEIKKEDEEKSDYLGCIREGRAKSKINLDRALRTVKKPKAQEALKAVHVAFITALEGISPGIDERQISYEQRQQALKDKIRSMGTL